MDLGYDPQHLTIESRCYSELADLPRLVAELLDSKPALVAVWGSVIAVRAVQQAAPTLPIVFVDVTDPVRNGLVASLGRPGGNMTGNSNVSDDLMAKRVQILRDALPRAARLGVLCNLANPISESPANHRARRSLSNSCDLHQHRVSEIGCAFHLRGRSE